MASDLQFGDDYKDKFDGECYLKTYYSSPQGAKAEANFLPVMLQLLHHKFSNSDNHKGTRVLDFGSGPCIHSVISASRVYTDITLSDYSESNRKQLQQWINREQGAHDWMPIISHIASLEGETSTQETIENRVRKSIQEVLPCDILQCNPLHPNSREPYDCVISSLCLEATSNSLEAYKQSVKHLSSLLKSNGICVVVGVLEESFYEVGQFKFSTLKLSASDVECAFKEAGFNDISMECRAFDNPECPEQKSAFEKSDFAGFFIMSANKQ